MERGSDRTLSDGVPRRRTRAVFHITTTTYTQDSNSREDVKDKGVHHAATYTTFT